MVSRLRSLAPALVLLASAAHAAQDSHLALKALLEREWQYELAQSPIYASTQGERRWNGAWDDLSAEALAKDQAHHRAVLAKLAEFSTGTLSEEDGLEVELYRHELEAWTGEYDLGWHLLPTSPGAGLPEGVHQRAGVQAAAQLTDTLRFTTVQDYADWVTRLQGFGRYVDQVIALMREGQAKHLQHPKVVLERIPPQLARQLVADPTKSRFFQPFTRFPKGIAADAQTRLTKEGRAAVEGTVLPALKRFQTFLTEEHIPAAPTAVGISNWPRGTELYALLARTATTTTLTPEAIHTLGLSEVKRIRAQMETLRATTGFKGTLPEFFRFLREAPRFYEKNPGTLLMRYRSLAKQIDPRLTRLFRTFPRMPYGVEPTPDAVAPDVTTGFYYPAAADGSRAGTYLVNLYKPETRPLWEMVPLTLHESVPGHHLQTSLAAEQTGLSAFRRNGYFMAYGEGWALYCETLGDELGLYTDPYDKFGQLAYEMWRAVRLVVDTGMHVKGWTRQHAIDFFLENSPRQRLDVTNEVDRYIANPGQALAYKIGQLKIRELRTRAEKALGEKFDVREFHDVVLLAGSLPLDVLERRVDAWLAKKQ